MIRTDRVGHRRLKMEAQVMWRTVKTLKFHRNFND